ncbi:MAG TPA: hypothetical protein VIL99_04550 [Ignavibacteria bacterium]|jgi:hypothetical protein
MEKITLENMDQVASQKTCNCPDCGSNELKIVFIAGGQTGIFQNSISMGFNVISRFSGIKAIMCTNCRLIIKQFADKT